MTGPEERLAELEGRLAARLAELGSVAVAFSGGVDSALLLDAARRALGERAVGVIADSPSLPRAELARARAFAAERGIDLVVVATQELADARYRANAGDRCFFCKEALFEAMQKVALERGLAALAFSEIADDALDARPGSLSARARGVAAPLAELGFTKADVRALARQHGLPQWDQPASACLASRLPPGTAVSAERLERIERAEADVRALGFRVLRVRDHGRRARLELGGEERARADALREELERRLSLHGFAELELASYVPPAQR